MTYLHPTGRTIILTKQFIIAIEKRAKWLINRSSGA